MRNLRRGTGRAQRPHGRDRVHFYGCTSFWKRGANVCTNNLVARIETIDAQLLATLQDDILRPSVVEKESLSRLKNSVRSGETRTTRPSSVNSQRCGRNANV